jgi:hypothetical protein
VSAHRAEPQKNKRWKIAGLIGGLVIGLIVIGGAVALLSRSPAAVAPGPIGTLTSTATVAPSATATRTPEPSATPTKPAATATPRPTSTATPAATLTATATVAPTRAATRVLPTATPTISIAPLTLAIPRRETRDSLQLTFSTNVQPAEAGIIGALSLEVPAVEPLVIDRVLAQVGSGDQVLRVGVSITCGSVVEPITSQQVVMTLRDAAGQTLLTQTLDYTKRWCQ